MDDRAHERIVIGALLLQPNLIEQVGPVLAPDDFVNQRCRWCYQQMIDAQEIGEPFTVEILCSKIPRDKNFNSWITFIDEIVDQTPTAANAWHFARKVKEAAITRKIKQHIDHDQVDYGYVQQLIESELGSLQQVQKCQSVDRCHVSVIVKRVSDEIERGEIPGLNAGFDFLCRAIPVLAPTHFWVVGGYTSVGKSAFLVELLMRVFEKNDRPAVAVFSTEMSASTYIQRMISSKTGIPALSLLQPQFDLWKDINNASAWLYEQSLWVFDDRYTFGDIRQAAKRIKEDKGKLDVVVVDFMQNVFGQGSIYERMSSLAIQLQWLAKELHCTVIAASQVPNDVGGGEIIRFKGAGEIAAAVDVGLWLARVRDNKEMMDVSIRKNRAFGPVGDHRLKFAANWTRLIEVS